MAFHFDFEGIKKHPYAVGVAAIVGGLILFYLLSSRGTATASAGASNSSSDFDAELQASQAQAQVAAQESVANNQTQASELNSQLEASVANNQTAAALQANSETTAAQLAADYYGTAAQVSENETNVNATTTQEANQLIETQNTTSMQDAVLDSQINAGVVENANNNATALAGNQQDLNYESAEAAAIIPLAGQQKNSITDADNQTALFQTILKG